MHSSDYGRISLALLLLIPYVAFSTSAKSNPSGGSETAAPFQKVQTGERAAKGEEAPLYLEENHDPLSEALEYRRRLEVNKRPFPRWHHSSAYRQLPSFAPGSFAMAERKRFGFHPLARFRGISSGRGISSIPSRLTYPYPSFVDSPVPSHPIPSDPRGRVIDEVLGEELDEPSDAYLADEPDMQGDFKEMDYGYKAADLLEALNSLANNRGVSGHTKSFRFGISK